MAHARARACVCPPKAPHCEARAPPCSCAPPPPLAHMHARVPSPPRTPSQALMCVGAGEPAGAGAGGRNSTGTPKASFVEQQASQSRTWLMWPTQHTAKQ